jgi:hypothetical protein
LPAGCNDIKKITRTAFLFLASTYQFVASPTHVHREHVFSVSRWR